MIYQNILETRKKAKQEHQALAIGKATINILQLTLILSVILAVGFLTGDKM